jgi:predicted O-methyltransferase YrrM
VTDAVGYIIDKWDLRWSTFEQMPLQIPNTNRVDLAKLFNELGYRKGAEIGTLGGQNARTLKTYIPDLELYCVDPWEIYEGMQYFTDPQQMVDEYDLAKRRLAPFGNIHFVQKLSMDSVRDFDDNSLDFVFVDANHELPYVTEDIFYWSKKVRPGGIVSGHDYIKTGSSKFDGHGKNTPWHCDVKAAVHAYTDSYNVKPFFVIDDCTPKRAGSFLWVKL